MRSSFCFCSSWHLACGTPWSEPTSCNFERLRGDAWPITFDRPVVLTGLLGAWPAANKWSFEYFLRRHGDVCGYARVHDHLEIRDVTTTVAGYLDGNASQELNSSSAAFFVNDYEDHRLLDRLQEDYTAPVPLEHIAALRVISLEHASSGVAFHRHEEAWQALVTGKKEWFLMAPTVDAVHQASPCGFSGEPRPLVERCVVKAGDVLYVPAQWWHATCSLDFSVAVGAVGSVARWPRVLVAAKFGDVGADVTGLVRSGHVLPSRHDSTFVGGEGILFLAAAFGRKSLVDLLLEHGANPDDQRRDGRTALHEASRRGDFHSVVALRTSGADVLRTDLHGNTALHFACAEKGDPEVADFLLANGAKVNIQRHDGARAVHTACRSHRSPVSLIRILVKNGASPYPRDSKGATPLMLCAATGHAKAVGLLLRMGPEAAHWADHSGQDVLDYALTSGVHGVIGRLLEFGLPVVREGLNRVLMAARLGQMVAVRLLAEAGGSVAGAVLEASRSGHVSTVQTLVSDFGADTSERDDQFSTPLHLAALNGHLSVIRLLLDIGVDATSVDAGGMTPLHYGCMTKARVQLSLQKQMLQILAIAGWWQLDFQGHAPLHFAAASGDTELVKWLAQQAADPGVVKSNGATAADLAEQEGHSEVATFLRSLLEL
mmetsp:Transcript_43008/g.113330  ORF Transcript_43008/g.113330 Transcript_43008/m.113330 type:complete len:660 (-) Transcript_43008:169-2148(-)